MNGQKMNARKFGSSLGCAAVLFWAGCGVRQQYETIERICTPNIDKQEAMQIAEDVLGRMHFTIAKADAEQGLVRTKPMSGAQFFETWRRDNVGRFSFAEANLHTIRRTVELHLRRQGEELCIDCDVAIQRLNLPEREVTSTRAYMMFSQSSEAMQRLEFDAEQKKGMAWIDLGKDTKLSTRILKRIETQIAKQQKGTTR